MKMSTNSRLALLAALVGLVGCQFVAGLEEREVAVDPPDEPSAGAAGVAGSSAGAAGVGAGGAGAGAGAGGAGGDAGAAGQAGMAGVAGAAGTSGAAGSFSGGPPPRPPGPVGEGGGDRVSFVAQRFFLGQRNEDLTINPAQWKNYGFNWDRVCTTQEPATGQPQNEACQRPLQAFPGIADAGYYDGLDCRDNAFGGGLLPLVAALQGNPEVGLDEEIVNGTSTFLLRLSDLSPSKDDPYVPGELFFTAKRDVNPAQFNLSPPQTRTVDVASAAYKFLPAAGGLAEYGDWPASGVLGDIPGTFVEMTARTRYLGGYLRDHIWVSSDLGAPGVRTYFPFGGYVAEVDVSSVVLMVELDPDNHARALRSQFAAVLAPQSFTDLVLSPKSNLFKCGGTLPASTVAAYINQTADLRGDAVDFKDPTKPCDRISMGAGIQWVPTTIGPFPKLVPPTKFECVDGKLTELPDDGSTGGAGGAGGNAGVGGESGAAGAGG
jgi:hypothetical protein